MHLRPNRSITTQLAKHDYTRGTYFVTINAYRHSCIFGNILIKSSGIHFFKPNPTGAIVLQWLTSLKTKFPTTNLLIYQLMPNHLHLILDISRPKTDPPFHPLNKLKTNQHSGLINQTPTLGHIIRYFKAETTHHIRQSPQNPFYKWQRNYYEHIIRDQSDLQFKMHYVKNNPIAWSHDPDNPAYSRGVIHHAPPQNHARYQLDAHTTSHFNFSYP